MKSVMKFALFLWPGSTGALRYGLWKQLGIALLFGFLCQATLCLNFYWRDFCAGYLRFATFFALGVSQLALSAIAASQIKAYERMRNYDSSGKAFLEAQTLYLRGAWFEAECCLKAILKRNPADVDAMLLLATLYRHVKRFDDARRSLSELEKFDAALFWREEIAFERQALREDENDENEEDVEEEPNAAEEQTEESVAERLDEAGENAESVRKAA